MKEKAAKPRYRLHRDIILPIAVILFVIVTTLTGLTGPLDTLELKVFDFLMQSKKATTERDDIVIVAIDDSSIGNLGTFPWSRDVVADGIIRMRELGAASVTFDIEYCSPSKKGIDPDVERKLTAKFDSVEGNIQEYFGMIADVIASGYYTADEIVEIVGEISAYVDETEFQNLYESVNNDFTRDMDEYFAEALAFFGNSWVTLNVEDMGIDIPAETLTYLKEHILLNNVTDPDHLIHPECNDYFVEMNNDRGLTPAMLLFLEKSNGAGFTNIVLDSDGTRRRVKLLFDEDDQYAAQLVLAPILTKLNPTAIERTSHSLILHDALNTDTGKRSDIVIPLDENGNMLINWIKDSFLDSFKYESFLWLYQLDEFESSIIDILRELASQDDFTANGIDYPYFYNLANYLVQEYTDIGAMKDELLATATAENSRQDPRFDQYFAARRTFFEDCQEMTSPKIMEEIEDFLTEYADDETHAEFTYFFTNYLTQFTQYLNLYNEEFAELQKNYSGAFCIIGHTATASTDLGSTPFQNHYANVGTHANVYNTIMTGEFITPVNWYYGFAVSAILLIIITVFTHGARVSIQNLAGIAGICLTAAGCIIPMQTSNIYIPVLPPLLVMILGFITSTIYRFIYAEKDKRFLRSTLSTYVSKDIVNEIVDDPTKLKLGGDEKNITAIFTDIRSFSTISEKITPVELVSFLNRYLTLLSNIILENGGTIDKYEGDAIIAFVGAPVSYEDHAWRACISAVRMKQAEAQFNMQLEKEGIIPDKICMPICTRIGINTGNMVVGNMGTENKMNYTMMGNAVNLASRLEGVNKVYGSWILVSETTWNAADSGSHKGQLFARRFDRVRVVGIDEPVQLYNILGFTDEVAPELKESTDLFHKGMELYSERNFREAKSMFEEAWKKYPEDKAAAIFAARCGMYLDKGVPDDWDGVINLQSK